MGNGYRAVHAYVASRSAAIVLPLALCGVGHLFAIAGTCAHRSYVGIQTPNATSEIHPPSSQTRFDQ